MRRPTAFLSLFLIVVGCQQSALLSPTAPSTGQAPTPSAPAPTEEGPTTEPSITPVINGRIAFRRFLNAEHSKGEIFTINADGTGLQQVTRSPKNALSSEPAWSPDGQWIVYMVARGGDLDNARLARIRPDGTDATDLAGSCTGACLSDGFPAVDPSGQLIAFERHLGPQQGEIRLRAVFVMDADGTNARQITQQAANLKRPNRFADGGSTFAPSGELLAFNRFDPDTYLSAIFTVALDGTGEFQVTPWELDAAQPDFSPDGEWILFRSHETSSTEGNVWMVRPDGTDAHAVTDSVDGEAKWLSGSFSPDGLYITNGMGPILDQRLACELDPRCSRLQDSDVYVMRLDGSDLRNLTEDPDFWDSSPEWGPAT